MNMNHELPDKSDPDVSSERQGLLSILREHADFLRVSGFRNTGDRAILGAAAGAVLVGETIGGTLPTLLGAIGGAAIGANLQPGRHKL